MGKILTKSYNMLEYTQLFNEFNHIKQGGKMPILSFENPLTYVVVILLLGVAYTLYKIATKKENEIKQDGIEDSEENEVENTSPQPAYAQIPFTRNQKYYTLANCKKIIPNFFSNGSYLVIDKNGSYIRKKRKYCSC